MAKTGQRNNKTSIKTLHYLHVKCFINKKWNWFYNFCSSLFFLNFSSWSIKFACSECVFFHFSVLFIYWKKSINFCSSSSESFSAVSFWFLSGWLSWSTLEALRFSWRILYWKRFDMNVNELVILLFLAAKHHKVQLSAKYREDWMHTNLLFNFFSYSLEENCSNSSCVMYLMYLNMQLLWWVWLIDWMELMEFSGLINLVLWGN